MNVRQIFGDKQTVCFPLFLSLSFSLGGVLGGILSWGMGEGEGVI